MVFILSYFVRVKSAQVVCVFSKKFMKQTRDKSDWKVPSLVLYMWLMHHSHKSCRVETVICGKFTRWVYSSNILLPKKKCGNVAQSSPWTLDFARESTRYVGQLVGDCHLNAKALRLFGIVTRRIARDSGHEPTMDFMTHRIHGTGSPLTTIFNFHSNTNQPFM